jgi:hypothetical protein
VSSQCITTTTTNYNNYTRGNSTPAPGAAQRVKGLHQR